MYKIKGTSDASSRHLFHDGQEGCLFKYFAPCSFSYPATRAACRVKRGKSSIVVDEGTFSYTFFRPCSCSLLFFMLLPLRL